MNNAQLVKKAEKVYATEGAAGVYDLANAQGIKLWSRCVPCDAETPSVDGSCLVCSTTKAA
jgi:hypothetical protein